MSKIKIKVNEKCDASVKLRLPESLLREYIKLSDRTNISRNQLFNLALEHYIEILR